MNAHTHIDNLSNDFVSQHGEDSQRIMEEIQSVELEMEKDDQSASSFAARVNNMPLEAKFALWHKVLCWYFAAMIAVGALALLGGGWAIFSAIAVTIMGASGIALIRIAGKAMNRDLLTPLKTLVESTERVAMGARDVSVPGSTRGDEIGTFARTVTFLIKAGTKMDELYQNRRKAEAERMANAEKRKQDLLGLAARFETSIGEVANGVASAANQLQSAAQSLSASAEGSISRTTEIAEAMEQVAGGTTAAAAASDEFALSIQEISRQAADSANLARKTKESAEGTDATVTELSAKANGITEIAELIHTIAGRTNLLALNASIEAARGGETGRGFAVVASEVKELASQTSRATGDVTDSISKMQTQADASIAELREISDRVRQLEIAAISIATAVDQQSVAGKELALNIDLAANGAGEVSATTSKLREAALAAGSSADQFLSASNDLKAQASLLNQKASEFLSHIRAEDA